ncbi:MAG TPA: hypothetical protein VF501_02355, partial [Thiobacillus sp.]
GYVQVYRHPGMPAAKAGEDVGGDGVHGRGDGNVEAVFFAWHAFWPQGTSAAPFAGTFDWFPVIVAIAAFVALWKYKADIMQVIGVCALLGLAYTFLL